MKVKQNLNFKSFSKKVKLALVVSRFNKNISDGLLNGAKKLLAQLGLQNNFSVFEVPGAFEIPLVANLCAKSKKYDGVVCLGAVIKGDTPHFDYVCSGATQGVVSSSLQTGIPHGFGVITTNTLKQAVERSSDDDFNKGREAVLAVLETLQTVRKI